MDEEEMDFGSGYGAGIAATAVLDVLIAELVYRQLVPRADMERVLANARRSLSRKGTQGAYGDADRLVTKLLHRLPRG